MPEPTRRRFLVRIAIHNPPTSLSPEQQRVIRFLAYSSKTGHGYVETHHATRPTKLPRLMPGQILSARGVSTLPARDDALQQVQADCTLGVWNKCGRGCRVDLSRLEVE